MYPRVMCITRTLLQISYRKNPRQFGGGPLGKKYHSLSSSSGQACKHHQWHNRNGVYSRHLKNFSQKSPVIPI